jgi:hypothetical protein
VSGCCGIGWCSSVQLTAVSSQLGQAGIWTDSSTEAGEIGRAAYLGPAFTRASMMASALASLAHAKAVRPSFPVMLGLAPARSSIGTTSAQPHRAADINAV